LEIMINVLLYIKMRNFSLFLNIYISLFQQKKRKFSFFKIIFLYKE
jgi:hypothetical protein